MMKGTISTIFNCLCARFPFVQPGAINDPKFLAEKLIRAYAFPGEADLLKIPITIHVPKLSDVSSLQL